MNICNYFIKDSKINNKLNNKYSAKLKISADESILTFLSVLSSGAV